MHKTYQTAIVGGGASGLMSAIELTRGENKLCGEEILLLEKNDRVGKKLVATGNGQGNLTNANLSATHYYGDRAFIEKALSVNIDVSEYLEGIGIKLCTAKDGKKYPLSKQASSVLDIIRARLSSVGVQEKVSSEVLEIKKADDGYKLITKSGTYYARTVILCCGGAVAKQFGTDGSAYKLAENFGHKLTSLYPSLVQLKTETNDIKGLKGLKETARISATINGKEIASATGDLLFTEFGVSGSSVFSISANVTDKTDVTIRVEFLPELNLEQVERIIEDRQSLGYLDGQDVYTGLINKRIGQALLKSVKERTPKAIATALKNFTLKVTGNLGFNYAQVTKGGIKTDDINASTMQSNLQKGIYIVGEMLDVDGDCGGYNLNFAFLSGIVAAKDIKTKI